MQKKLLQLVCLVNMSNKIITEDMDKKKMVNGNGKGNANLSPKQKRAFVKMLSKFIRLVEWHFVSISNLRRKIHSDLNQHKLEIPEFLHQNNFLASQCIRAWNCDKKIFKNIANIRFNGNKCKNHLNVGAAIFFLNQ